MRGKLTVVFNYTFSKDLQYQVELDKAIHEHWPIPMYIEMNKQLATTLETSEDVNYTRNE